jgi:hypothetical protein
MTSVLNVDTIADKAGTGPVGLTKQNTIKAFYISVTTFGAADNSFAVSSSTDDSTGNTTVNFTNAFDSVHHVVAGVSFDADGDFFTENKTTTAVQLRHQGGWNAGGSKAFVDADLETMMTGDLA